jgi:hypothetical protein
MIYPQLLPKPCNSQYLPPVCDSLFRRERKMRSIAILARTLLFCGIVSIMFSQLSQAQVTTGSVHGTVTDKSNAAVPGAELVLTNISTNLVMQQKSDDLGQFVFNVVPPGIYTLTATSPGFNSTTINNVRVQVDNNTVTNVMLDVGAVRLSP